jgi:hypothetical protein
MKYPLRRYWIQIALLTISVFIITYLGSTSKIKPEAFVGILVASITTFIASMSHFHNTDKFFKELFTEFNARYDDLNGFLNQVLPDAILSGDNKQKIIDYLNLSAEEFMWVKKGRIPEGIWKEWKNGIRVNLRNKAIKQVFDDEKLKFEASYYGFFAEMDKD